ncbi:MAG: SDR family oxidoreductase [Bacteroidetes bacterium]|nr:SDR family oxidoreductase [Bacteroidota bacterium]
MKVFITGNLGYIGAYLTQHLKATRPNVYIAGYDLGYFQHRITSNNPSPERAVDVQFYGDVRDFDGALLNGYDAVVHLAAISNDPIGKKFEEVTYQVNHLSSVDIAKKARLAGVKNFVFASSCSVYGAAGDDARREDSDLNPLTAYAISKVRTEQDLATIDAGDMNITCLRFATACGISDRLRLDLVVNDFVASAMVNKKIEILSDGTPLRPLINIKDMSRAIDWAIARLKENGGQYLVCNTGSNEWNYMVKDLAYAVQAQFDNVDVSINESAAPDKRSYKVNFDLFTKLAEGYTPTYNLEQTVTQLKKGLEDIGFNQPDFRSSEFMRLNVLNKHLNNGDLDSQLRWKLREENKI